VTTSHPTAAPLQLGDPVQVGSYTLRGRLGSGGMGMVYLATDPAGDPVAVKIMRGEFADNPVFRDRFRREVDAARRVPRFCTAAVRDADPYADPPYLVTDYVPGPTLTAAVHHGPLRGADLEQLAIAMATALTMIHSVGVIHRDLKPGNVILSPTGARVIDFGLAVAHDMTVINGPNIGTPSYMAPEAFHGAPPSPAMDVFAWAGVVLFAASRVPPFEPEPAAMLPHRIAHEQPPNLHRLAEPLRAAVNAAMAKDPAARPTAEQLYRQLTGPAPIVSTPTGTAHTQWVPANLPAPRTTSSPPPPTPYSPAPPRPSRRRPVLLAAATGIAALAVAVVLVLTTHETGRTTLTASERITAGQTLAAAARTQADPALAQRLAVAAWPLDPAASADTLLSTTAGRLPPLLDAGHSGPVTNLAVTSDGRTLATASKDGTARLWDLTQPTAHPTPLATLPQAGPGITLAPDGHEAVSTGDGTSLRLWDIADRTAPTRTGTYTIPGAGTLHGATFDADGHTLAVTTDSGTLYLLDATDRLSILATIHAHDDAAVATYAPHNPAVLVTASLDSTARLWDLTNPHTPTPTGRITLPDTPTNIAISPDGHTLAVAQHDGTASLWDIHDPATPQPLATLPAAPAATDAATSAASAIALAFDATSRRLAAPDGTGNVHLWDLTDQHNPKAIGTIHAHNSLIYDVMFTGPRLITAGSDSTAKLWDLDPGRLYQRACATGGGAVLTRDEWSRVLPHLSYLPPCRPST
jgi:serine/threonine protein kinase/WD40 repeat protein